MTCTDAERILPDYFEGRLDPSAQTKLLLHLEECADCRDTVELWNRMGEAGTARRSDPSELPGPEMAKRFALMIESFREGQRSGAAEARAAARQAGDAAASRAPGWRGLLRWPVLAPAFAAGCMVIGLIAGLVLSGSRPGTREIAALHDELRVTRQLVTLSLLQQQSASDRLRGVTYSYSLQRPDTEVIAALFQTLATDSSVDVRLAAADALHRFISDRAVRQRLASSFAQQESPLVQIALIDMLGETRDANSAAFLHSVERNQALIPVVRQRAGTVLKQAN